MTGGNDMAIYVQGTDLFTTAKTVAKAASKVLGVGMSTDKDYAVDGTKKSYDMDPSLREEAIAKHNARTSSRNSIVSAYMAIQLGYDLGYAQVNLAAAEAILADRKAAHLATYREEIKLTIRSV